MRLRTDRLHATRLNPTLPAAEPDKVDLSKFPGGIVPTKLPSKRLIRGYKSGR